MAERMTTLHPLRCPAGNGPRANLDGPTTVEQDPGAAAVSPPRAGVRPLPDATGRYTPEQIEAIHDQALDRAECYIDVPTAVALYEHWTARP